MRFLKWSAWIKKADDIFKTHPNYHRDAYEWFKDGSTPEEWALEAMKKKRNVVMVRVVVKVRKKK